MNNKTIKRETNKTTNNVDEKKNLKKKFPHKIHAKNWNP